jgi:transcriptional regulator with XRE-family HTH domain
MSTQRRKQMTEKQLETFSANLRALMGAEKLSQSELARQVGIDRASINRIVNGERMPTLEQALAIAKRFRRKVDDLINKTVVKNT